MEKGSKVRHAILGEGEVIAVRDGGSSLQVRFLGGHIAPWIKARDLVELGAKTATPAPFATKVATAVPAPPSRPAVAQTVSGARRLIEALRLGIVPPSEVSRFTFGRDSEKEDANAWLRSNSSNVRLLLGEYGSGKTHFLECIRGLGLDAGFAVASVSIDINDCPLYRPRRIYRRLVESLRYRDATGRERGFHDFLRDAASHQHPLWGQSPFLRPLHGPLKTNRMEEAQWDWITATANTWGLQTLHDETTAASLYCNLLSSYAVLAREALGLGGLLLLFDEAEMIDTATTRLQIDRGFNLLRALSLIASNDPRLLRESPTYEHDGQYGQFGAETGLRYSGRMPHVRFAAKLPSHLKIVFAFAPSAIVDDRRLAEFERIDLEPLDDAALDAALHAIGEEYAGAYGFRLNGTGLQTIAGALPVRGSPRLFLKGTVEALDLARFYQDEPLADVLTDV